MSLLLKLLLLLLPTCALSSVTTLTADNFAAEVASSPKYLIKFYAEWCGHCKRMAPTYAEVGDSMAETYETDQVKVGKVDGANERAISSRFGLTGFPALYLVDGWHVHPYKGSRTKDDLVLFAKGGYKSVEPMSFVSSPFGPLGYAKGTMMGVGNMLLDCYEWLVGMGLPKALAGGIMCVCGMFGSVIWVVMFAYMTSGREEKRVKHD